MQWLTGALTRWGMHQPVYALIEKHFDKAVAVVEDVLDARKIAPHTAIRAAGALLKRPPTASAGPVMPCHSEINTRIFRLLNERTGKPLRFVPYRIEAASCVFTGRTDWHGRTSRVETGDRR